jgi:chaperone BCS1
VLCFPTMDLLAVAEAHPVISAFTLVATGAVISALQKIPSAVWGAIVRYTTVQLEVDGSSLSYKLFENWLNRHSVGDSASTYIVAAGDESVVMAPGFGTHYIWHDRRLLIVSRQHKKDSGGTADFFFRDSPQESIRVTAVGPKRFGRRLLQTLVDDIHSTHLDRKGLSVRAWRHGYWFPLASRVNRPLSTVVLPAETKQEMVNSAQWFFDNNDWFVQRGIPWRCSFLFKGPPGTGKSSTVCALGTHFHRPVCIMNLSTMGSDDDLLSAFMLAPKNSIILIEDVDAMNSAASRAAAAEAEKAEKAAPATPSSAPPATKDDKKTGITLSGLLNAIDGVAAPEGRLLILTTNHPEKLDPALTRKARVDKEFYLGPLSPELVEEMATRFFPDDPATVSAIRSRADLGPDRPAADWQDDFMVRARAARL